MWLKDRLINTIQILNKLPETIQISLLKQPKNQPLFKKNSLKPNEVHKEDQNLPQ